ncbi:MAG TPA: flagellar protein FlgN [Bradyrhizobium sp.]|nr:flagellar protein FlgN [Bradyrhizobium sp.]
MRSETKPQKSVISSAEANAAVERVIALVDELSGVIEEENKVLAQGIPASLSKAISRKNELAGVFEVVVRQVADHKLCLRMNDNELRQRLVTRVRALRVAMKENTERLRAAMEATRRRIDAVMRAIKSEMQNASPYGANGRLQESRLPQSFRGGGISI